MIYSNKMILHKTYDIIAVLGNGFTNVWQMPSHMINRLDIVAKLYSKGVAKKIAVCGKWSINYDRKGIVPPVTEAQEMKDLLVRKGIPSENILKEEKSEDTLGNAYFLKKNIVQPNSYKNILVICSDYQKERAVFLFKKVFGKNYNITMHSGHTPFNNDPEIITYQKDLLARQKIFLKDMVSGDDTFLDSRLYSDPFYRKADSKAFLAMGRMIAKNSTE